MISSIASIPLFLNVKILKNPYNQNRITIFAPNAPAQNPVEDIWLKGKNHLHKCFSENKTFAQVKKSFCAFFQNVKFDFPKLKMYQEFIL
jgi:transposase